MNLKFIGIKEKEPNLIESLLSAADSADQCNTVVKRGSAYHEEEDACKFRYDDMG